MAASRDLAKATRFGRAIQRVNVDFPVDLLRDLDQEARRLGVTRQAFIKIFSGGELGILLAQQRQIRARTERWLRATVNTAVTGVDAYTRVLVGAPATELTRLAREVAADLVVIPQHWATAHPLAALLVGSPVATLMRHAPCPVLVAPDPTPVSHRFSRKDLPALVPFVWQLAPARGVEAGRARAVSFCTPGCNMKAARRRGEGTPRDFT